MFSQINDKYKVKDWTKSLGLQTLSCSVTAKVKSTKLWTYFTLYAYCITVLGLNRELSASTATCMRNQCFYGCNHPAISNGVITITNIKSLWNSCPSFAQYKPTELMQQCTELFPLHCYCFPCWASSDPNNQQQVQSVFYCSWRKVLIVDRLKCCWWLLYDWAITTFKCLVTQRNHVT